MIFSRQSGATDMSLWVDKYRPAALSAMSYHTGMAERLARLVRLLGRAGDAAGNTFYKNKIITLFNMCAT